MSNVPGPGGANATLNVTTATVIKNTPGTLYKVVIITAPTSGSGGIYDSATTSGLGASNLINSIESGLANSYVFDLSWPCKSGITVNPGTGGVVSVSWT